MAGETGGGKGERCCCWRGAGLPAARAGHVLLTHTVLALLNSPRSPHHPLLLLQPPRCGALSG